MSDSPNRIFGFCCQNALNSLDKEKGSGVQSYRQFEPTLKVIALPCSSKIDTLVIVNAFETGADGIFVLGCPEDECRLLGGNHRAKRIVNHTKKLLEEIGIESDRLEMFQLGTNNCKDFDQIVRSMTDKIESLDKG